MKLPRKGNLRTLNKFDNTSKVDAISLLMQLFCYFLGPLIKSTFMDAVTFNSDLAHPNMLNIFI